MGMEAQEGNPPERPQAGRQNSSGGRRQNNYRGKRNDSNKNHAFGQSFQPVQQANGHFASEPAPENGILSNDSASIDRHILKLSTEAATIQEEISHYRRVLDDRSELNKLRAELQTTRENAETARQYHLTSVSHLEEKLKATESECDEMKNRLRSIHEASEQQQATLNKYEARIAQQDAVDREKSGQLEELSRKLGHAHVTSEQYRSQAEATERRLAQSEDAKRGTETELANLKLEVLAQSDNRKMEEAARVAGFQQAQKDYEALVKENQNSISILEADLREALAERQRMEGHYKKECEHLCNVINAERRKPLAPLLTEKELVGLVSSLLPVGEDNAAQLGPGVIESLQKALWPNTWEHHYAQNFGSVFDFMSGRRQQFLQRSDGAFYRVQPSIRFGSAPVDQIKSQDAGPQSSGKRLMTPEERTVGPPLSSASSLLGRLQRGQEQQGQRPQVSLAEPTQPLFGQLAPAEVQQPPRDAPLQQGSQPASQAVVVTPFHPQAKGKQRGAAATLQNPEGHREGTEGNRGVKPGGWSSAASSQKQGQQEASTAPQQQHHSYQEPAVVSQQEQAQGKPRKQNSKSEGGTQAGKNNLPPGIMQGRQRSASSSTHGLEENTSTARGQTHPSQAKPSTTGRGPAQANAQDTKHEASKPGHGAQKGDRGKQQSKRGVAEALLVEERLLNLPPGFESAGKSGANGPAHKQEKQTNNGAEGGRKRGDSSAKQQGASTAGRGAAESAGPPHNGQAETKPTSKSEPQTHASWENGDKSQPQRQGRNRRKAGREAAQ